MPDKIPPTAEPERLTPEQSRSLHRIIWHYLRSTVYFWVPAIVFLSIANEVKEKEPVPADVAVLNFIHTFSTPFLNRIFELITALGSAPVIISGVLTASAAMWYLKRRRDALFLLFGAGGTAVINMFIKLIFERQRPDLWEHLVVENSFSFPSGHAMISSALALSVIVLAWNTKYRWAAVITGALYTLLVGVSRLYLGVHFPSDVLAGWCVSVLWIITLHQILTRHNNRRDGSTSE